MSAKKRTPEAEEGRTPEEIAEARIAEALAKHDKSLNLGGLGLTTPPKSLLKLANLRELFLRRDSLRALPEWMDHLTQLELLHLSANQLTALPDSLGRLTQLKHLYLSYNQLTTLPDSLGRLTRLELLNLTTNQLTVLPDSLRKLSGLKELYLHDNPDLHIPNEVLGPKWHETSDSNPPADPARILEYYFRARGEARPLNEAKLILVGRGGAGKTTLVKRLVEGSFDPEAVKATKGIHITDWSLNVTEGETVRLNVWDFGGQEIMHATHQFFLTERSLYLLVVSGREGTADQDVNYWLQLIDSFGGDSPVIIVLNKIKEHPFELNERELTAKYTNIRAFIRTDCLPGFGISKLYDAISTVIVGMDSVRVPFPASWFLIKDALAKMANDYMSFDRYRELCRAYQEADAKAQELLAESLHCLGIALNYKDDPRLRDTSVLNPRWVTDGVYLVLNAKALAESKGMLPLAALRGILPATAYPAEKHAFLMGLMCKFGLCFRFHDDGAHPSYLVPELLEKQEPVEAEEFAAGECLNFEYRYTILPEGILPRFIVRSHILSGGQPRWRSGVVLTWEGSRALVKGDTAENKAIIRVRDGSAETRRRLLGVIRADFEHIHTSIPGLMVTMHVPVPDYPTLAIDYQELIAFEENGIKEFPKSIDSKVVNIKVADMLNGVDLPGARPRRRDRDKLESEGLKVFISYSHNDDALRERLDASLKLLQHVGILSTWSDRRILPGEEWKGAIDNNLETADIILLLISDYFFNSDYCRDVEMSKALERHAAGEAIVVPIIIRDVNWPIAPLAHLQALPKDARAVALWADKDSAWRNVSEGIERVAGEMRKRKGM